MTRNSLCRAIFGGRHDLEIDMVALWRIIDSFPDEEVLYLRSQWNEDGSPTPLKRKDIIALLPPHSPRYETIQSRAFRKLRHSHYRRQYVKKTGEGEIKPELSESQEMKIDKILNILQAISDRLTDIDSRLQHVHQPPAE